MDPVMRSHGGTWVAWGSGNADRDVCRDDRVEVPPASPCYALRRVWLTRNEISGYYYGFSNRVLWPLAHCLVEKTYLKEGYWRAYKKVNAKFAKAVLEESFSRDMIWVHDYHLALLPRLLRDKREDARIAFFWHIPFPPWEILRVLPWRDELLKGLLGSDLLGFHVDAYARNFLSSVEAGLRVEVDWENRRVKAGDRGVAVRTLPIGVDFAALASRASAGRVKARIRRLKGRLGKRRLILGVDRLDYTKGILGKFKAFEAFLERYPRYREKVVLVQVASPSRTKVEEYRAMKKEVDEAAGRINGRFQRPGWTPLVYINRYVPMDKLLAYYNAADVALVTPLADGMNLVAKEYVAVSEDGVLVLSEFAGAAAELEEALIVNPYDMRGFSEAIRKALQMPRRERKRRLRAMIRKVKDRDVEWWLGKFFEEWKHRYGRG